MLDNIEAVKLLLEEITSNKPISRNPLPDNSVETHSTGSYSDYTYGHRVRAINSGRSSKEGNSALTYSFIGSLELLSKEIMSLPHVSQEIFDLIRTALNNRFNSQDFIVKAVENGNFDLAGAAIKCAPDYMDFNFLHKEVLTTKDGDLSPFRPVNVTKKSSANNAIMPLHCAAINPNPKFFSQLLSSSNDPGARDLRGRRALHYAAASSDPRVLELLLKTNYYGELDNNKFSPLMAASAAGRLENVKVILNAIRQGEISGNG